MQDDLQFKNYTEELVADGIKDLWGRTDNVCKCRRCFYDTMALALNQLPPQYVVTAKGEVYGKLNSFNSQIHADVMKEVTKANVIVNGNYSHSPEEVVH